MIRLFHAYPDLLNLYGPGADLAVLSRYLRGNGAEVRLTPFDRGETPAFPEGSFVYFGAATEEKMLLAARALAPLKDALSRYAERGGLLLFVGASAALPLEEIETADGRIEKGLGLVPGRAVIDGGRRYSEICEVCNFCEGDLFGAVNTSLTLSPQAEEFPGGYRRGTVLATELCTPVLRNPVLLRRLAELLLERRPQDPQEPWFEHLLRASEAAKKAMFE